MYSNENSPFDQALSNPILGEPAKKKWKVSKPSLWFSSPSSRDRPMITNNNSHKIPSDVLSVSTSDESISFYCSAESLSHSLKHDHGDCELCPILSKKEGSTFLFNKVDDDLIAGNSKEMKECADDIENPLESDPIKYFAEVSEAFKNISGIELEEDKAVPANKVKIAVTEDDVLAMNVAILRERNEELGGITTSMKQINQIQQELGLVIESQGETVNELNSKSFDVYEQAQSGMENIMSGIATSSTYSSQTSKRYSMLATVIIVLCVGYIAATMIQSAYFLKDQQDETTEDAVFVPSVTTWLTTPEQVLESSATSNGIITGDSSAALHF